MECPKCHKKTKRIFIGQFPAWFCKNAKCEDNGRMVEKGIPSMTNVSPRTKNILRDFRNLMFGAALFVSVEAMFESFSVFSVDVALILVLVFLVIAYQIALLYATRKFRTRIQYY